MLDWSRTGFLLVLKKIFAAYPNLTLLVTESDNDVMRLRDVLENFMPEHWRKITIAGFGCIGGYARSFNFPTVDQHKKQMGAVAAEKLISLMENEGGQAETPVRECIPCRLVNAEALTLRRR